MPKLTPVVGSKRNGKTRKVKLGFWNVVKCIIAWLAFDKACIYCGKDLPTWKSFTIDHIVPQSYFKANGLPVDNSFENCVVACLECNRTKREKSLAEWSEICGIDFEPLIAAKHAQIATIDRVSIHQAAIEACKDSTSVARKYQRGRYLAKFHPQLGSPTNR